MSESTVSHQKRSLSDVIPELCYPTALSENDTHRARQALDKLDRSSTLDQRTQAAIELGYLVYQLSVSEAYRHKREQESV